MYGLILIFRYYTPKTTPKVNLIPHSKHTKSRKMARDLSNAMRELEELRQKIHEQESGWDISSNQSEKDENNEDLGENDHKNRATDAIGSIADIQEESEHSQPIIIPSTPTTPRTISLRLAEDLNLPPKSNTIKKILPFAITMSQVRQADPKIKKGVFKALDPKLRRKYRVLGCLGKQVKLGKDNLFKRRKMSRKRQETSKQVSQKVVAFLEREDNSFQLPGKKRLCTRENSVLTS